MKHADEGSKKPLCWNAYFDSFCFTNILITIENYIEKII